jgi:hypothetical protein
MAPSRERDRKVFSDIIELSRSVSVFSDTALEATSVSEIVSEPLCEEELACLQEESTTNSNK